MPRSAKNLQPDSTRSGPELAPTPRARKIALHSHEAVARELRSVYRDARSGLIAAQDATRFAYVLEMLSKIMQTGDLAKKVDELEALTQQVEDMSEDERTHRIVALLDQARIRRTNAAEATDTTLVARPPELPAS
jgi:hypothetical protein